MLPRLSFLWVRALFVVLLSWLMLLSKTVRASADSPFLDVSQFLFWHILLCYVCYGVCCALLLFDYIWSSVWRELVADVRFFEVVVSPLNSSASVSRPSTGFVFPLVVSLHLQVLLVCYLS